MAIIGYNQATGVADSIAANSIVAVRFFAREAGTTTDINARVRVPSGTGNFYMYMYTKGGGYDSASAGVQATSSQNVGTTFTNINLAISKSMVEGTEYWLCVTCDAAWEFEKATPSNGETSKGLVVTGGTAGTMPSDFNTPPMTPASNFDTGVIWATYTPTTPNIIFAGFISVPVDDVAATGTATQVTITPPVPMVANDLMWVTMQQRGTATHSVGVTGGQSWSSFTIISGTNISLRVFYCTYNGTWTASPRFDFSAGTCTTVMGAVARPADSASTWGVDQTQTSGTFTAGTTPFTKTITGITNAQSKTISVALWATADDNEWGTLAGSGWSKQYYAANPTTNQWRNTSGSDQSLAMAYKIMTSSGATGNVSQNQATLGGDAGVTSIFSFYEIVAGAPAATKKLGLLGVG